MFLQTMSREQNVVIHIVEGAEVDDAIVIRIKSVRVTNGNFHRDDSPVESRFVGDPLVATKCPGCGETKVVGTGPKSVRCSKCGNDVTPFVFTNDYTITFDFNRHLGVTLYKEAAEEAVDQCHSFMNIPEKSVQT